MKTELTTVTKISLSTLLRPKSDRRGFL